MTSELLIQIALLFIGLYLAFFKSYLTEKGKSAALKEDVAELTHEVEKVKNEFNKDQEFLKSNLQRLLSKELSYQNEVRNSLILFHSVISEWKYSILEIGLGNYNKANIEELISDRKRIAGFFAKAGIAKSKVELLVDDNTLVQLAQQLYVVTLEFNNWSDKYFSQLQFNSESQKSLTDQFLILIKRIEENRDLAENMAKEEKELKEKAKELFDGYYKLRNTEYEKIIPLELAYSENLKDYLKK